MASSLQTVTYQRILTPQNKTLISSPLTAESCCHALLLLHDGCWCKHISIASIFSPKVSKFIISALVPLSLFPGAGERNLRGICALQKHL